jgi:type IV pilus assembly protein PilW
MRNAVSSAARRLRRQAGFTLVELSVALVIALFLLSGLFMMEQSTRKTSTQQTQLAQLEDSERLAMTIMTDVIQETGFFSRPNVYTAATALPSATAAPPVFTAGQGLYGVTNGGQDTVYVQYMSEGPLQDNMILCNGQQTPNTAPNPGIAYINQFNVNATGQLLCTVSTNVAGTLTPLANMPVVLVEGVKDLTILYGVATTGTNGNSVDTYMTAAQVAAAANGWAGVSSVKVKIRFANPLYPQPGQTQQYITFERVIGIMNRADG